MLKYPYLGVSNEEASRSVLDDEDFSELNDFRYKASSFYQAALSFNISILIYEIEFVVELIVF